jgi:hypothetical protein
MRTAAQLIERALAIDARFGAWSKGPSATEEEKCERAVAAVKKAVDDDPALSTRSISVFAQGSYRNRTNIRAESDVDVCVKCDDVFFADYPTGTTKETFGNVERDYKYSQFKKEVENALVQHFGQSSVTRGNKAFDIHENSYRIDADVVPVFGHRRYFIGSEKKYYIHHGVEFRPDGGGQIINWPQHNYDNGIAKRERTRHRYKKIVRVLKHLRNEMQSDGVAAANNVASFLIECLVWNAPNELFGTPTLTRDVECILRELIKLTSLDDYCQEWGEVNELKYLFCGGQPWTRDQAHNFLCATRDYVRL